VTTILKALQELERRAAPSTHPPTPLAEADRKLPWPSIAAAVLTLVGGAVGLLFLLPGRHTPGSIPRETAASLAQPQVAPQQPARVSPLRTSPAIDEPPWGLVGNRRPAAPPPGALLAPAPLAPAPLAPAKPAAVQQARPRREAPKTAARAASSVPGEPQVQVKSIAYSSLPAQRTVTLQVQGASAATLHEGESVNGMEVQLILPDAVYLRHGASVFAVGAVR
jgi:hypothetical protein